MFVKKCPSMSKPDFRPQAAVVQTLDSAIHCINPYPADGVIDFRNTYRYRCLTFEQPGPDNVYKLY